MTGAEYLSCIPSIGRNVMFIFSQNEEEIPITSLLYREAKPVLTKGMKIVSLKGEGMNINYQYKEINEFSFA